MFVYESFARSRSRPASTIARWSKASSGRRETGCQRVSSGTTGSTSAGTSPRYAVASSHSSGLRSGSLSVSSCSRWASSRTSTFCGEVAADRLLERLARLEVAARERPGAEERLARPLPEQRLQPALAHLEHDRQRDVGRARAGRLSPRFSLHRRKLPEDDDSQHRNPGPGRRAGPPRGRPLALPQEGDPRHRRRLDVRGDGDPARRLRRADLRRAVGAERPHAGARQQRRARRLALRLARARAARRPDRAADDLPVLDPLVRDLHGRDRARPGGRGR